jgi:hypothetical protein
VAAIFERRIRDRAHQADHAAAINEFNLFAREQGAELFRRRDVFGANAFVGAAINCDAFHLEILTELNKILLSNKESKNTGNSFVPAFLIQNNFFFVHFVGFC